MTIEPHRNLRHLRNYLLDRPFQLRYALLQVGVVAALTIGMGAGVEHYMEVAERVVEVRGLDPTDTLAPMLRVAFQQNHQQQLLFFALCGFLLLCALFALSIVLTHRVAGPLYKISLYMQHIRDGRLGQVYSLRKRDQLVHFFAAFSEMHAALRERTRAEAEQIAQVEQLLAAGKVAEAQSLLRTLHEEKLRQLD